MPDSSDITADAIGLHRHLAKDWDERYQRGGFARRAGFIRERILGQIPLYGTRWLDVGCGTGYFCRELAEGGAEAIGIDGASEMIEVARQKSRSAGFAGKIDFHQVADVSSLDFPDESFDGCICFSVVEYLKDPDACISEMVRVLRPGGWFVASFANRSSAARIAQRVGRAIARPFGGTVATYLESSKQTWTRRALREMTATNGLKCQALLTFDAVLPSLLHGVLPPGLLFVVARKTAR